MKVVFVLFLIFFSFSLSGQEINTICKNKKPDSLNYDFVCKYLKYHAPAHISPRFKVTLKTAFDKKTISELIDGNRGEDMLDGFQLDQIIKYNLRIRWKLTSGMRLFCGTNTLGTGFKAFYIGYRSYF